MKNAMWLGIGRPVLLVWAGILALFCVTTWLLFGQVFNVIQPTSIQWADETGTNALQLSGTGPTFSLIKGGATNYTAITTNMSVTNALRLNIQNGLIVNVTY